MLVATPCRLTSIGSTHHFHRKIFPSLIVGNINQTANRCAASATTEGSMSQNQDPLIQYVALRSDLWKEKKWPLGSIIAQGCHAATAAMWISKDSEQTLEYCCPKNLDHMRKVCLLPHHVIVGTNYVVYV